MNNNKNISFLPEDMKSIERKKKVVEEDEEIELSQPEKIQLKPAEKERLSLFSQIKSFFKGKKGKEVKIKKEKIIPLRDDFKKERPKGKAFEKVVVRPYLEKEKLTVPIPLKETPEEPVEVSFVSSEEDLGLKKGQRFLTIIICVIIGIIIIAGFYIFLNLKNQGTKKVMANLEGEIEILTQDINKNQLMEIKTRFLEEKVKAIENLLNNHICWTNFFSLLEKYTLPEIQYLGLKTELEKEISLKTIAPDYYTAAKQLLVLQSARDFVKEVGISELKSSLIKKTNKPQISFNIILVLKEGTLNCQNVID